MKRIISVILTIAMVLGISMETFAAYTGEKAHTYQSDDCTITYSITNEWSGNQQISVSITNDGEETLRNWAVMFDNAGEITNIWNAEVCRNDGELCVIRNNGYNYEIIPNGTVEFGFMLQGNDLSLPEDISLCSRTADSTESAEIRYEIQNNWGDGFIAAVTINNISDEPLEAWRLSFNGNFEISSIWNANRLHTEDGSFKVENDITTTPIAAGSEKTFSFQGAIASGETPVMSDFQLTSVVIDTERTQPEPPAETEEASTEETSETTETDESGETSETEEPVEPEEPTILCFGEYLSEENSLEVYWYSTAEGAVSVHENTDNGGWNKLTEVTDGDSYKYEITEDFLVKYIKVHQITEKGTIESEPFIVAYTEDGYVCTWLDSDNDGLPDYAEKIYGTDPNAADTDGDTLSDYDEIYKTGTNPLKYDTDEDGVSDADSDNDKDGLTNSEELSLGTDHNSADTDGDGLSDYDEINKYNTDPLKADSDGDTLNDGNEITLGLDPNNPETFGVPDAEYKVEQVISADSEVMERVNTEDSPYELSLEITASGNAQNLIAGSSAYSTITESDARLGGAVSLSYYGGDVEKVKLTYEIGENYISNEGSEYAENCVDLQGIKRYNIFRYFEELNMLLPVATEFDEENNTLFAETDELGTYCVLDLEVLLQTFGVNPDGTQTEQVEKQMYAGVNDGYNVCFIIDTREGVITDEQLDSIKAEIISFMNNAVANGKTIGITICTQNYTDFAEKHSSAEYLDYYSTVEELTTALEKIKLTNKYEENDFASCCISDGISLLSNQSRGTNNYIFDIFSQTNSVFNFTGMGETERNIISSGVNISFITDGQYTDSYQTEIPQKTKGIVINSFSNFAKKAYNHVFEEPLVEFETFSAILATGYQEVELDQELNSYNGCDTDEDTITDWDEVGVNYWATQGLITFDENNNVVLPSVERCMTYAGVAYVKEALDDLQSKLGKNFGDAIASKPVMPILSDPTSEDGDGDGWNDIDDSLPLSKNTNISENDAQEIVNALNEYLNSIMPPKYKADGTEITNNDRNCQETVDYFLEYVWPVIQETEYLTGGWNGYYIRWFRETYGVAEFEAFWVISSKEIEHIKDTVPKAIEQVFLGRYSDDITVMGTAGEIIVSFSGVDFVADVRDVVYDVDHWEWSWECAGQTAIDLVCVLPIIGSLKAFNKLETVSDLKRVVNGFDSLSSIKHIDNDVVETIKAIIENERLIDNIEGLRDANLWVKVASWNNSADTVVLGKYIKNSANSYEQIAISKGYSYFNLVCYDELQNVLGSDFMWEINEAYLDVQVSMNKKFLLNRSPYDVKALYIDGIEANGNLSSFGKEMEYLRNKGYTFSTNPDEFGYYYAVNLG